MDFENKIKRFIRHIILIIIIIILAPTIQSSNKITGKLIVSDNGRFFSFQNNSPFFWLGDTGWLLFSKLNREDAEKYLEDRRQKGFNVIQVMILHDLESDINIYGDSALINNNISKPKTTVGNLFTDTQQYDFWDHVDYIVDRAADKGIYMAMVPVWGANVKEGKVTRQQAKIYAEFLANRYKDRQNIIWLNGGDIKGTDSIEIWNIIGNTLHSKDPDHLITFHPRGRGQSSKWFHKEPWLSFNMIQSGHRRYNQDTSANDPRYGEDNWKYINADYDITPVKPTLDGEPSYENIPQGLHDTLQPRWNDNDVRRYGYWSVFAGGCGFTYGDNSVMQFHRPNDKKSSFGARVSWTDAIHDPGSSQIIYLKNLMLSRPYFERIPDQSLIAEQGKRYNYLAATRGKNYAFIYTYNGRNMKLNMGIIAGNMVKASWYNPRYGSISGIGMFDNKGVTEFDPPGNIKDGNDWVLILDSL